MVFGRHDIHLHSMTVHFTSALYPAAVFFLVLSFFYRRDFSLFAYLHLMLLATLSAPVSYFTGIVEWKQKYKKARVRIFIRKQRGGMVLVAWGSLCALWYGMDPEIMHTEGFLRAVFLSANAAIVPLVVYLGTLGGKLVFGGGH